MKTCGFSRVSRSGTPARSRWASSPARPRPDAPVGEFAGGSHAQGQEEGHFAGGEQRGGSFADADREEVVSYPGGVEHARDAGHHRVKKVLTDAGLDDAAAERD